MPPLQYQENVLQYPLNRRSVEIHSWPRPQKGKSPNPAGIEPHFFGSGLHDTRLLLSIESLSDLLVLFAL